MPRNSFRHSHGAMFGKSDLFFVCILRADAESSRRPFKLQPSEIAQAKWAEWGDFLAQAPCASPRSPILSICAQGRGIPSRMQPSPSPPPCHSRQHAYTPVKAWCRLPSGPRGLWAAGTHVTRRCGRPCTVVARGRTVWSAPAPGWTRSHSSTACGVVQATATLHRAHDDLVMRARSSRRHA